MNNQNKPVSVTILGKEYRIACNPGEENDVVASALHLDERMREIRGSGKVLGTERIAVMAALNLANEVIKFRSRDEELNNSFGSRIESLRDKLDTALGNSKQLSL